MSRQWPRSSTALPALRGCASFPSAGVRGDLGVEARGRALLGTAQARPNNPDSVSRRTWREPAEERGTSGNASAPPWDCDDVGDGDWGVVADAPKLDRDRLAVGLVLVHDGAGPHPFVSPLAERDDDRLQLEPLWGQQVLRLLAGRRRLPALHQAGRHEALQALGEDVRGDAQALLKLREARAAAEHRVAQDQQAPALADQFQRPRGGTVLTLVEPTKHTDPNIIP